MDVVISSRVRLARNQSGLPYTTVVLDERINTVAKLAYEAMNKRERFGLLKMSNVGTVELGVLREKRLVSLDLIKSRKHSSLIISEDEMLSIMVGEEDHLRIQAVLRGLKLREAFTKANQMDDRIAAKIKYSFDPELGYLTSCPTNLGTGMRASVMLFLPALAIMSKGNIAGNLGTPNITVRGIYGEGSDADGYMYQVSNSRTLGVSEHEIIDTVTKTAEHLITTEARARDLLINNDPVGVRDQIVRAYGILTNAYTITAKEFMRLIALVKLGVHYKFVEIRDAQRLETLIIEAQPSGISYASGRELTSEERDICRADYVGKILKSLTDTKIS